MLLLLFCFALAYAIQGAAAQAWTDGKTGATTATGRARDVYTAKRAQVRKSGSRRAKVAFGIGGLLGGLLRGTWWVGRGTGRAVWTGGRAGWEKGWEKGRARARQRAERRNCQECGHGPHGPGYVYGCRDDCSCRTEGCQCGPESEWNHGDGDPAPTWGNYFTGRCPRCRHLPKAPATETDGCGCDNVGWGCVCARRNATPPPEPEPEPDPEPEPTPTPPNPEPDPPPDLPEPPSGGDGSAASDNPTEPEPTDPTPEPAPPAGDPTSKPPSNSTPEETPMPPITGEASDLRAALAQIAQIRVQAITHLDTAAAVTAEANELTAAAERLGATLATAEMDQASRGAVARLREHTAALGEHARQQAAIADRMVAAADEADAAISAWLPIAERMRALGATPDSKFVAGGVAQPAA